MCFALILLCWHFLMTLTTDPVFFNFLVIFSKVRSMYLQNSIGQILLYLRYHARVVWENYELHNSCLFQKFYFSVTSTQVFLTKHLSLHERLLLSYKPGSFFTSPARISSSFIKWREYFYLSTCSQNYFLQVC